MKKINDFLTKFKEGEKGFVALGYNGLMIYNNKLLMRNKWNKCIIKLATNVNGKIIVHNIDGYNEEIIIVAVYSMSKRVENFFKEQ